MNEDSQIEQSPEDSSDDIACPERKVDITALSTVPRWRICLFRLIAATIIPVALLLTLEISLRAIGYGYPANALTRVKWKGQTAYSNNYQFGWSFWPRSIARESEPFIFPAKKPKDTYRIFVLGGSAALGTPEPAYAFCRSLEVMLENQYPKINFEVINTAITAINSHVVLPIAKACSSKDGDLFIVYLGNNEVIGPYGAGTIFAPLSDKMVFIRFDKAVQTTKLGQLLKNITAHKHSNKSVPKVWGGSKMFMENHIRKDDENLQVVYDHYKKNLEDITKTVIRKGAQVILCSVGSNIKDSAPFASLHRACITDNEKEKWNDLYEQGIDSETSGRYNEAIESYLAAAGIDNTYADLRFRTARAYWELGDFEKARNEYIFAREFDALRLRADNRINQVVRQVADNNKGKGVYFVDSVQTFARHSPHNTPGEELLYEHVHMNFKGNYILANAIFQKIENILPQSIKSKRVDLPVSNEDQCRQRLAFTDWDKYLLYEKLLESFIKKAPFTSRLYNDKLITTFEQELENSKAHLAGGALEAAKEQYIEATRNVPDDWWLRWRYAQLLTKGFKDLKTGAEQYHIVTQLVPNYYSAHTTHALTMFSMEKFQDAINSSSRALAINPYDADAHHLMGVLLSQKGDTDKAMQCFSTEVRIRPDHSQGYNRMGVILDKQGRIKEAEDIYRKGLIYSPDDVALHYNLVLLLAKQGRFDDAIEDLHAALKLNPRSPALLGILNKIENANKRKKP